MIEFIKPETGHIELIPAYMYKITKAFTIHLLFIRCLRLIMIIINAIRTQHPHDVRHIKQA